MEAPLIELTIPVRPLTAEWRTRRGRKLTKKKMNQTYFLYKNTVRDYAAKNAPLLLPLTQEIEVEYTIFVTGNQFGDVGDHDNYSKALGDALEGVLWLNDNQIRRGTSEVVPVRRKEDQRIEVRVWPYHPGGRFNSLLRSFQQELENVLVRKKETAL